MVRFMAAEKKRAPLTVVPLPVTAPLRTTSPLLECLAAGVGQAAEETYTMAVVEMERLLAEHERTYHGGQSDA